MELEKKYLKDIAHHLDEAKWDRFGHQRAIMSHGIQDSGLLREMASTRESIARLAAMADFSFDAIVSELTINNQMMSGLLKAVQNPRATAAGELYNSRVEALYNGWIPEAIKDLEGAAAQANNLQRAGVHYALGRAYAHGNNTPKLRPPFPTLSDSAWDERPTTQNWLAEQPCWETARFLRHANPTRQDNCFKMCM